MPYTTNKNMPRVRRDAVRMLKKGHSVRTVARHFGFSPSAISKWSKKSKVIGDNPILTQSSRPKTSPKKISFEIRNKVSLKRKELGRSIEVVHYALKEEGITISLSSVYRILCQRHLIKRKSPWKKFFRSTTRPLPERPGSLVQMDTMHFMTGKKSRIYVYAIIDLYSRIGYARATKSISSLRSVEFLREAKKHLPFTIMCIQTDHGPEFGRYFSKRIGTIHRHSRIRKPNDNAHVERFNRTLQEECINLVPTDVAKINRKLKTYLKYYNTARHHFSLNFKAPNDMMLDNLSVSKV